MVAKFCSRSQGQPVTGVRSAAMISIRREMSREGVIAGQSPGSQALCQKRAPVPRAARRNRVISTGWRAGLASSVRNAKARAMSDVFSSETALVLFSGGQDSTTCLAWALNRFARVETLGFDYGQRHAIELACRDRLFDGIKDLRADWASRLGESHTLSIPTLAAVSETALTRDVAIAIGADGLPNTFVPGRNLVFLTFAAALAYRRGISHIVGGMCETDYSGYPDCRDETVKALNAALNLGMAKTFELHTPLMWLSKAATWQLAHDLGGAGLVDLIRADSHTCYLAKGGAQHDWAQGCGTCPACELRAKGWREYSCVAHGPR